MKKSEVIKLMKEGTHCIYNDCAEKLNVLAMIFSQIRCENVAVSGIYQYYWIEDDKIMHFSDIIPEHLGIIYLSKIEPDNEKPYLYFEGEKYYFGEDYEFSDHPFSSYLGKLKGYLPESEFPLITNNGEYKHIRKIDHTVKYKKLLLELKEQADKDGVNLKELI